MHLFCVSLDSGYLHMKCFLGNKLGSALFLHFWKWQFFLMKGCVSHTSSLGGDIIIKGNAIKGKLIAACLLSFKLQAERHRKAGFSFVFSLLPFPMTWFLWLKRRRQWARPRRDSRPEASGCLLDIQSLWKCAAHCTCRCYSNRKVKSKKQKTMQIKSSCWHFLFLFVCFFHFAESFIYITESQTCQRVCQRCKIYVRFFLPNFWHKSP